jgi:hypothetical protein
VVVLFLAEQRGQMAALAVAVVKAGLAAQEILQL